MDSPPPPPLFVPAPQPAGLQHRKKGKPWVLIGVVGLVVLVAGLFALALPTYKKVQEKAHAAKAKRLDDMKPKGPLSEEARAEVTAFGEKLALALTEGNADEVAKALDLEAIADRVFIPLGPALDSADSRKGFMAGVRSNRGGLFFALLGNDIKYLRVGERDGFPTVRFRMIGKGGEVGFFDVLVRVEGKAGVRAVDIFTHLYGSYATAESRSAMLAFVSKDESNPLRSALGIPGYDREKLEALTKLTGALRLGRGEEAVSQYAHLPLALQNERAFFMFYLQALTALTNASPEMEKKYRQALADAPRILGKDSATDLLQVDLQFLDGDFPGAEASLQRTEAIVGRDAYLTQMRALMLLRQNKIDEAQNLEKEASAMEPDLINLFDLRLMIHAARKDYSGMVNELRTFKTKHQVVLKRDQLAQPDFEEFLKSPEYAKWEAENR